MKPPPVSMRARVEMLEKECADLERVLELVRAERCQLRQLLSLSTVTAAVMTERETCALLVEKWAEGWWPNSQARQFAAGCADFIRRRGTSP
ncbi:MAG TPA: hypothetical protein VFJ52_00515 [Terriglobia bacterium]|nr:hypothetical protein [Terriglobia bacterium]